MSRRKIKLTADSPAIRVRFDAYGAVRNAVEDGVAYGWRRVWKHRDDAPPGSLTEEAMATIADHVMASLCELLDFPAEVDL